MEQATVIVIGGGATGVGILRDLAMRGVDVMLVEKQDLVNGASSRYHGLLHSGGRYAVKDQEAAKECIEENTILRKIGKSCVEASGGMFVRLDSDDPDYEKQWVKGCADSGIEATPISLQKAFEMEPLLSGHVVSAYLVPDAAIDGFRMSWQNVDSAKRYGGRFKTYTEVIAVLQQNGRVNGIKVRESLTGCEYEIGCEILINAAGGWAGKVAAMAGLDVGVQPDKGTLLAFNQRIANHVVNRLHKSSDGDIFVPHGSITILGTTSMSVADAEDTSSARAEVEKLLSIGEKTFENLRNYRLLRAFAGSRPLYMPPGGAAGRGASRGFAIVNHESQDGLAGMFTIVGGKFTTYRLMAERMADQVCEQLGNHTPCRTAEEPLVPEVSVAEKKQARKYFPAYGTDLAATRLGPERFSRVTERLAKEPDKRALICECENVTLAEVEEIAQELSSYRINDVRRRTRLGMGTCQANFCALRSAGVFSRFGQTDSSNDSLGQMKEFLQGRWKGIRPVLMGRTLREIEMTRALYELSFNVNGGGKA